MEMNQASTDTYRHSPRHCAIYARYSSNLQNQSSIADQIRECRDAIAANGWIVAEDWVCSDEAKSGQSLLDRTGLEKLLKHAAGKEKEFDTFVADDTSRFGRNLSDSLPLTDQLQYDGVGLYFVKPRLASWEPHFRDNFIREQRTDEQYSVGLAQKVKRGQKGHVDKGFIGSGRTYGYTNVAVETPGSRGLYGRPKVEGVRMVINPDEAAIVKRIFEARSSGKSQLRIVHALNAERIPSTLTRAGDPPREWNVQTVGRILSNEKYVGVYIFNKRMQTRDPRTGRKKLIPRRLSDWQIKYRPELCIISNDLWVAVQKELVNASGKLIGRRKGGMNRTKSSCAYIFSGLLECGLCGRNIVISSGKPPYGVYGCQHHRFKGLCTNAVTISERSLSSQLITYLGNRLRSPEVRNRIVAEFSSQLEVAVKERAKLARQRSEELSGEEGQRSDLNRQIANCIDTAVAFGPSSELTARHESLQRQLLAIQPKPTVVPKQESYSAEEIVAFISKNMSELEAILTGDPEQAKREMQKRVGKLILTPVITPEGRFYKVSGDLRLFAEPDSVMLDQSVHKSGQHYNLCTLPIRMSLNACTGKGGPKAA